MAFKGVKKIEAIHNEVQISEMDVAKKASEVEELRKELNVEWGKREQIASNEDKIEINKLEDLLQKS